MTFQNPGSMLVLTTKCLYPLIKLCESKLIYLAEKGREHSEVEGFDTMHFFADWNNDQSTLDENLACLQNHSGSTFKVSLVCTSFHE